MSDVLNWDSYYITYVVADITFKKLIINAFLMM